MKRGAFFFFLCLVTAGAGLSQKMTVKDSEANVLMEVNDEGTVGSITLEDSTVAPSTTTNKLYNVGGSLYFNGSELGTSGSAGGWTDDDGNVHTTTSTDKVGIGTSSPEFKLSLENDGGILAQGEKGSGASLNTSGEGTRLIWYPRKAAFRAGHALSSCWDDGNIGQYSMAIGYGTRASGIYSMAIGDSANAYLDASTAIGYHAKSQAKFSTSIGYYTRASAYASTVIGRYNVGMGDPGYWFDSDPIFEIGIGRSESDTENALTVYKNGDISLSGGGYYDALVGCWNCTSSRAFKQDIRHNSIDILEVLDRIQVVNYRYKNEVKENPDARFHIGFISEDAPQLLTGRDQKSMATVDCIGFLLAVVKDQQETIEGQEKRIDVLESEIMTMKR